MTFSTHYKIIESNNCTCTFESCRNYFILTIPVYVSKKWNRLCIYHLTTIWQSSHLTSKPNRVTFSKDTMFCSDSRKAQINPFLSTPKYQTWMENKLKLKHMSKKIFIKRDTNVIACALRLQVFAYSTMKIQRWKILVSTSVCSTWNHSFVLHSSIVHFW